MQRDRIAAARVWFENAETDLALAIEISDGFPPRACFHAQQAAEFALKAALIALADDHPRTHVGDALVRELQALDGYVPGDVASAASRLDLFYMGARYPDALGGADPRKVLQRPDALAAVAQARTVVDYAASVVTRVARDAAPDAER